MDVEPTPSAAIVPLAPIEGAAVEPDHAPEVLAQIIDDMECEKNEQFEVELYEVDSGALGKQVRTVVTIVNDDEFNGIMNKLTMKTRINLDKLRVHNDTYAQQFRDAMVVNGGDVDGATSMDYVMHLINFPFKVSRVKF